MRVDRRKRGERGQTMVMLAVFAVGLLALVGLAIDGGTVFLERRRMQNAADAGAMAGTRKLAQIMCDESFTPQTADGAIWEEVEKFARQNGVRDGAGSTVAEYMRYEGVELVPYSPSVYVGNSLEEGDGIPTGATGISATTTITHSTYFVSLIGIETAGASAPAIAVTGPLAVSIGVRPFGVPMELVEDLGKLGGGDFEITFTNEGGEVTWLTKTAQHRGWMNLRYVWNADEADEFPRALDESADANVLKQWMEEGVDVTLSVDDPWKEGARRGDYIGAKPGTNASAACQAPEDKPFHIPVYDYLPHCQTEIPTAKPPCPTQGGGDVYHIVGFAAVEVNHCNQGDKRVELELVLLQSGLGETGPSAGYSPEECHQVTLKAIQLWK